MNMYFKLWRNRSFMKLNLSLFLVEFVRGAMLISFIPKFAVNELQLTVAIVGIAISIHYVFDTLAKMVMGYLLDRYSVRIIVSSGLFLSLLGFLIIPAAVNQPWLFIAVAAIYGLGVSPVWVVCLASITEEDRTSQSGFLYAIWLVGLGLGSFLINFFIDAHLYTVYWLLTVILGFSWISAFLLTNQKMIIQNQLTLLTQLQRLWKRIKLLRMLLPGMVLQSVGASMLVPVLPLFVDQTLHLSAAAYSFMMLFGGGCAIVGLLTFPKWTKGINKRITLIVGFFGFATSLCLLALATPFPLLVISTLLLGFSYAAVLPAWNALLARFVSPSQAAMGWGAFSTVEGLGIMIGPFIGGLLAAQFNLAVPILLSACLFGLMGCFYLLWFPKMRNS